MFLNWHRFKYLYFALFFLFIFSGLLSFYLMTNNKPQEKPPIPTIQEPNEPENFIINENTEIILQERFEVCEKYGLKCQDYNSNIAEQVRNDLNGLSLAELERLYPEGTWQIEKHSENSILLIKRVAGLCPEHKKIYHLGLNATGDYVTVYYGPSVVKEEGGIFKISEIQVKDLPEKYQDKIKNGQIEFYNEEEIIATLDSFSEYL